jgi:hypothetical protein
MSGSTEIVTAIGTDKQPNHFTDKNYTDHDRCQICRLMMARIPGTEVECLLSTVEVPLGIQGEHET